MNVLTGLARRFPVLVVVGVVGVGGFLFREHLSGAAADLRVGDCFDLPAQMEVVDDVQHRPCGDPHHAEVFFVGDYRGGGATYPADEALDRFIEAECLPAFESYTGRDFDTARDLDYGAFVPIAEGWREGDREVTCYLVRVDGGKTSGSLRTATGS